MVMREMERTSIERQWEQTNQSEQRSGPSAERPSSLDLRTVTKENKQRLDSNEAGSELRGRAKRESRETMMGGTFFLQPRRALHPARTRRTGLHTRRVAQGKSCAEMGGQQVNIYFRICSKAQTHLIIS